MLAVIEDLGTRLKYHTCLQGNCYSKMPLMIYLKNVHHSALLSLKSPVKCNMSNVLPGSLSPDSQYTLRQDGKDGSTDRGIMGAHVSS